MRRTIRNGILAIALVAAAWAGTPATAATGASDTASPNYRTDAAATTSNTFACDGEGCPFVITTRTSSYPCTTELVVLASGQPALLYQSTFCQVSITGRFVSEGAGETACTLHAVQALTVRFTSGANAAFDGSFTATGLFKPTGFSADRTRITQAQITVKGADTLDLDVAGTGSIKGATFTVRLPGAGIDRSMCYPSTSTPGYVSAVPSHGTIVVAP
jgi:hypothetical protein